MDIHKNKPEDSRILYLVDFENIGGKALYQHIEQHSEAEYVIFCSDATATPESVMTHLPLLSRVQFVNCRTGENNAMDFCICAMAGRLSVHHRSWIKILSKDRGYDAMLHLLQEQGIRILRETVESKAETGIKSPKDTPLFLAIRSNVPKKYQEEVLNVLSGAVSRKEAHEMLQAVLPAKMASNIYQKLRKHIPKKGKIK